VNAATLWRWGVVLPVTLAALSGAAADIVTGTLAYWWLLAPSYPIIYIGLWRALGPYAPPPPTDPLGAQRLPLLTPGGVLARAVYVPWRLFGAFGSTFVVLVCIWGVIAFLTWVRPYWPIYIPVLLALAGFAWLIRREGEPRKRRRRQRRRPDEADGQCN
jgi:hypothetical protein